MNPESFYERRFHSASFVMLPGFSALSIFTLYRLFLPWGAPIRMGSAGFVDLRAGTRTIPWNEISNVVRRGDYVSLTLKPKFAKDYPISLSQKVLKATRRSAGPTHLLVADWCLATETDELAELISLYRDENSGRARRSTISNEGAGGGLSAPVQRATRLAGPPEDTGKTKG